MPLNFDELIQKLYKHTSQNETQEDMTMMTKGMYTFKNKRGAYRTPRNWNCKYQRYSSIKIDVQLSIVQPEEHKSQLRGQS